jgi:hypothetical protein
LLFEGYEKNIIMKQILMICTLVIGSALYVNAQDHNKMKVNEKDVPQSVKSAFNSNFPNASNVEWKMYDGKYKAKFTQNGEEQIAEFSSSGELISKGTKISKDQLPPAVTEALKTSYANKGIDEAYKIEKGNETYYKVKLAGEPKKAITYTADGKVVNDREKK